MRVRAKHTIKRGGKYHVPGTETAIFEVDEVHLEEAAAGGQTLGDLVEVVDEDAAPSTEFEDVVEYPLMIQRGLYQLSDGSEFEGNQAKAHAAQQDLDESDEE